jgi:adenylate cyclase
MAEQRVQRRLAAILAADMVGYSRLMEADEVDTIARQKAHRTQLIDPQIAKHNGRIVKTIGDGLLAEFPSVVDAVSCAVEVQQAMVTREADVPDDQRIRYRVGINLGDIVIDGEDILGEGVNIASRLEGLSEPGGIFISRAAHDQIQGKLPLTLDDLGRHRVKNIARPVHVYQVRLADSSILPKPTKEQSVAVAPAEKPSIAVLPFANMSADPEQEYFADGMVEDITTGLSRIRWLTVIARNSCFVYKGRAVDLRQVGRELGVRYVLEGSVRRAADRVRITAQLVEAENGGHLWADRFDGTLADVFDLQDQITAGVVAAIEPSVRGAEIERAKRKRPDNLDAYDSYLRALERTYTFTPAGRTAALSLLEAAVALQPDYAEAHGLAAFCRMQRFLWEGRAPADRDAALAHAETVAASRTDDATTLAFAALAISALAGRHDAALAMVQRALAQNPSSATAHNAGAVLSSRIGQHERAKVHSADSLRLSPFDPMRYIPETAVATVRMVEGDREAALAGLQRALAVNPAFAPARIFEAACLARLGRLDEAKDSLRRLLEKAPDTRIATLRERTLNIDDLIFDAVVNDLRSIGLPE